jgi:hypothetical protein
MVQTCYCMLPGAACGRLESRFVGQPMLLYGSLVRGLTSLCPHQHAFLCASLYANLFVLCDRAYALVALPWSLSAFAGLLDNTAFAAALAVNLLVATAGAAMVCVGHGMMCTAKLLGASSRTATVYAWSTNCCAHLWLIRCQRASCSGWTVKFFLGSIIGG